MKKKTKMIITTLTFCLIMALGVCGVYAVKSLGLGVQGSITFVAPAINATISKATLVGMDNTGTGTMQEFTVTSAMDIQDVQNLAGYKTWTGIALEMTDKTTGTGTLSFTVTNNSSKNTENIMVTLGSTGSISGDVTVTKSADFCVAPGKSHTFTYTFAVDTEINASISNMNLTVKMDVVKSADVPLASEFQTTNNVTFSTNTTSYALSLSLFTSFTEPPTTARSFAVQ